MNLDQMTLETDHQARQRVVHMAKYEANRDRINLIQLHAALERAQRAGQLDEAQRLQLCIDARMH
jgi:hypothetical protein